MRMAMAAAAAAMLAAGGARAADVVAYPTTASFEDASFELRTAIESRGFVIDYVSHVGEMLNRTAADVGAERTIFKEADVYQFCSATLSRKMMEIDPLNVAHCPYGLFVAQGAEDGAPVRVGYARLPVGPMQEVQSLLDQIAREASGFE